MNTLQREIVRQAWEWKSIDCRESVENGGTCIDDLHSRFGTARREPYCTKLVWVVINDSCRAVGVENLLPKTAGAKDLLDRSRRTLKVDNIPTIGSVFYRRSRDPKATGHCGIVVELLPDGGIRTLEGNNDDRIDFFDYAASSIANKQNGFAFIHTELMGNTAEEKKEDPVSVPDVPSSTVPLAIAAAALLAAIIFF